MKMCKQKLWECKQQQNAHWTILSSSKCLRFLGNFKALYAIVFATMT